MYVYLGRLISEASGPPHSNKYEFLLQDSSQQWLKYEPLLNGAFDELMDLKERPR